MSEFISKSDFKSCVFYFRHGAEVIEGGRESKKPKRITFGGTGYRLGETENDTEGIVWQPCCYLV